MKRDPPRPPTVGKIKDLMLSELGKGMPGITPEYGECLAQAASICLEDQKHKSGVLLHVDGNFIRKFSLIWAPTTDQMRDCWGDVEFATEQGAYAIAALLVPTLTELTFFERSRKGTGIDYWLGSNEDLLFQKKARLEVSGIRKGNESEIRARLKQSSSP
jgi:hypothetical protein